MFALLPRHEHPSVASPAKEKDVVHVVILSKGFANEFIVAENDIAWLALNSADTLLTADNEDTSVPPGVPPNVLGRYIRQSAGELGPKQTFTACRLIEFLTNCLFLIMQISGTR